MRATNFIVAVAGLTASAGMAQAADLPMAKAEAVEYVKVCSEFGTGYFYIPGTDTCLKLGGLVRENIAIRQHVGDDSASRTRNVSAFTTLGRVNFDARTATEYGTLRSFIEVEAAYDAGTDPTTTTTLRYAYIQYMGFTAGLNRSVYAFFDREAANSLFDPYFTEQGRVNQLSYMATFDKVYASRSVEDNRDHRSAASFGATTYGGAVLPDLVGAIGYDDGKGGWGKVQAMAAVHQLRALNEDYDTTYGYAVGLGAYINLPVASGAYIAAETDYADGAVKYLNASSYWVYGRLARARDAYADIVDTELDGNKAWSATGEVGVTISPTLTWRAFGSYLDLNAPEVAGSTADYTVWTAGTHLAYTPVKGLLVVGEVDYINLDYDGTDTGDTDGWFGGMRIQRTF